MANSAKLFEGGDYMHIQIMCDNVTFQIVFTEYSVLDYDMLRWSIPIATIDW